MRSLAEPRPSVSPPTQPTAPPEAAPRFEFAGFAPEFVPYATGLDRQRAAAERIRGGVDRGTVFLLEHEPVYTAGRRSLLEEFPDDGTQVVPVDRGGKVTWHGPGQLVAYPVIRLSDGFGGVNLVRAFEGALIEAAASWGVSGFRVPGRTGVWAEPTPGAPPAKLAQIGIRVSERIVTHGVALNCSNELAPFRSFVPCGIADAGVTTLTECAGMRITPAEAAPHLLRSLAGVVTEFAA